MSLERLQLEVGREYFVPASRPFEGASGNAERMAFCCRGSTFREVTRWSPWPERPERVLNRLANHIDGARTLRVPRRAAQIEAVDPPLLGARLYFSEAPAVMTAVSFEIDERESRARRLALARLLETVLDRMPGASQAFPQAFLLSGPLSDLDHAEIEELLRVLTVAEGAHAFLPLVDWDILAESTPATVGALSRQPLPSELLVEKGLAAHGTIDIDTLCGRLAAEVSGSAQDFQASVFEREPPSWLRLSRPA